MVVVDKVYASRALDSSSIDIDYCHYLAIPMELYCPNYVSTDGPPVAKVLNVIGNGRVFKERCSLQALQEWSRPSARGPRCELGSTHTTDFKGEASGIFLQSDVVVPNVTDNLWVATDELLKALQLTSLVRAQAF